MFDPFRIIYFTPFYFPNGKSPAKNKYCIPILKDGNNILCAFLPTSQDYIPDKYLKHGCVNLPKRQISAFVFLRDNIVTNCGFSFERNTFVYFTQINRLSIQKLREVYTKEGVDYEIYGELNQIEKEALIRCIIDSSFTSQKIKRNLKKLLGTS